MNDPNDTLPPKLKSIVEDFQLSESAEKVELLLDYAGRLHPLPDRFREDRALLEPVEECMTPVFVAAELDADGLQFYFDVPPESPTVRGYAALMAEGLGGTYPEDVLRIPNDFYLAMGLEHVLTMQRLNGFASIVAHLKRLATKLLQ